MALSGHFTKSFNNSHYRLYVSWSATQSISGNTSKITLKTYIESDSTWSIYTSGKTITTYIDGSSGSASVNISSGGGKRILIDTRTKTLTHKADGTRTTTLRVVLNLNGVSISGSSLGTADTGSKSITLNRIPRKSTLSSAKSFTATNNYSCTISRASSSFTHKLTVKLGSNTIKTVSGIGSSATVSFSQAENERMLQLLGTSSSASGSFVLETFSGSTSLGSNTYSITISNPRKTTITTSSSSHNIGDNITFTLDAYKSNFTHTIKYSFSGVSGTIATGVNEGTVVWNTSAIKQQLYNAIPNSSKGTVTITIDAYLGSTKVNGTNTITKTLVVAEGFPVFTGEGIVITDYNTTSNTVTGDNTYFIQGMSKVKVHIPTSALATPQNGATMVKYIVDYGSQSKESLVTATQDILLDKADSGSDIYVYITAVDSRGLSSTISKEIELLKYTPPTVSAKAFRDNGFDEPSTVNVTINYSSLTVNGVEKNAIKKSVYKLAKAQDNYVAETNFSLTVGTGNIRKAKISLELNKTYAYKIMILVTDNFNNTSSFESKVERGVPFYSMDTTNKSIGVNGFPTEVEKFESFGNGIIADKEIGIRDTTSKQMASIEYNHTSKTVDFSSRATGSKEKTPINLKANGIDIGSLIFKEDLGNGRSIIRVGSEIIAFEGEKQLWSGGVWPHGAWTTTPAVPLDKCPNGWMLVWSDYDDAASTPMDYNWVVTYIHKNITKVHNGRIGICVTVGTVGTTDDTKRTEITKYIYVDNGVSLAGNDHNKATNLQRDVVLRYIFVY